MNKSEQLEQRRKMFSLIKRYLESNVSARDFYRQHNLAEHIFYYWRRKYLDTQESTTSSKFVAVEVQSPEHQPVHNSKGVIQIQYPNGIQVTVEETVNISRLRALIKVM